MCELGTFVSETIRATEGDNPDGKATRNTYYFPPLPSLQLKHPTKHPIPCPLIFEEYVRHS